MGRAVDEMGVVFASSVLGRLSIVADDVLVNALPTAAPELRGSALWVHLWSAAHFIRAIRTVPLEVAPLGLRHALAAPAPARVLWTRLVGTVHFVCPVDAVWFPITPRAFMNALFV